MPKKFKKRNSDSFGCLPLSTDTFTDQKPPEKLRWTFFKFLTDIRKKALSFSYIWTGCIGTITVRCFFIIIIIFIIILKNIVVNFYSFK